MKHKEISEKYQKWIIKFYSDKTSQPIFFIWLTDTSSKGEKDQILTTRSNKIIIATSKRELIEKILESKIELPDSNKMKKWLEKSLAFKKLSSIKFDLRGIENKILAKKLKSKKIKVKRN